MTHICVSEIIIIGSDNGLSPGRRQAIIWTNAWILLIEPLGTNFSEILIEIHTFSFNKMHLNMSSGKSQPFCLGLSVLNRMSHGEIIDWNILALALERCLSSLMQRMYIYLYVVMSLATRSRKHTRTSIFTYPNAARVILINCSIDNWTRKIKQGQWVR